jgi:hypothetical protein
MSRRWGLIIAIAAVCLLVIIVGGKQAFSSRQQTIGFATSPDGTWSVEVIAKPHLLTGSFDIVVEAKDAKGKVMGSEVFVGLMGDLNSARHSYAATYIDNDTARVENRSLRKSDFVER